ncbi:MAG: NAD(P)-dependent oxidoreductase [Fimbriimonadales bacterium]
MRIWYPKPLGDDVIDQLREMTHGHVVSRDHSDQAEMLIEGRAQREQIEACPNLKWVVVPFAGVPHATIELVREFPAISLHNLHHNAPHTAEAALALLFAAAKQIVPMDSAMRHNDWRPRYTPEWAVLLEGKTCLILGYGEIGRRIGAALQAIGMKVMAIRRNPSGPDERGPDHLHALLPSADVLMIAIPHNQETDGMIGARELDLMPDGAILVNVARAQIVDEEALFKALKSGRLHSAGLDVWYRYPQEEGSAVPGYFVAPASAADTPPSRFPFRELRNVVMSPHRGGAAAGTEAHRVRHLARLIEAAASGQPVPNRVNLDLGY